MATAQVFISYSREDRAFVERLSRDLRAEGIVTWQDTEQIKAGQNWRKAIEEGLRRSAALIYVASKHSSRSKWMLNEMQAVLGHGTRVFSVVIDDSGEHELPSALRAYQWTDFREGYDIALRKLVEALQPFQSNQATPKDQPKSKGYVFLSYAEEDFESVDEVKKFFGQRGYAYWDYRESDRDYHRDLYLELEGVIGEASATLTFLSPDWKLSRTAIKEFHFSNEVGTPVFLLRVRDPGPTLVVAGLPYIDFTDDRASGFRRLERELARKGL